MKDIRGQRFGRLIVMSPTDQRSTNGSIIWKTKCDCGKYLFVSLKHLANGATKSCGCFKRESQKKRFYKHGHSIKHHVTREYNTWTSMIARCSNPKAPKYKLYGKRGINVCKRWKENFENFLDDMGLRPKGMTIDRINPDGNYELDNCRWATPIEQRHNRRSKKKGERKCQNRNN